jgi:hypothetical protein
MPSSAQIAANRRNAQMSTGPRTPSGKAASCMNAMQSGLYANSLVIRGERADELDRLSAQYHRVFRPVTARERDLVDTMVRNERIVRRMGLVEAELWGFAAAAIRDAENSPKPLNPKPLPTQLASFRQS